MQDINLAELVAVLVYVRHLDPTHVGHVLYTDSSWVHKGLIGEFTPTPCTPGYNIWLSTFAALSDAPSVTFYKTKAHVSEESVSHSRQLSWERVGNRYADHAAKSVWGSDPAVLLHIQRSKRVDHVARHLLLFLGRLLGFCGKRGLLPPLNTDISSPTVPRLRIHCIGQSPCGRMRCVFCFRVSAQCITTSCSALCNRPHYLWVIPGHALFCQRCGAYSCSRTVRLAASCGGSPASAAAARRRDGLLNGIHPVTRLFLGNPRSMSSPAHELYVLLGELPE